MSKLDGGEWANLFGAWGGMGGMGVSMGVNSGMGAWHGGRMGVNSGLRTD